MRVVHVLPYALARPGGVQTHARDLCAWLASQGHPARVVAPPPGDATDPRLITVGRSRSMGMHGTRFELSYAGRRALSGLATDLRAWGADIVHLHTPWVPALPWQVWRMLGLPTVATFHATLPDPPRDPMSRALYGVARRMAPRLDGLIVPSVVPLTQWQAQGIQTLPHVLAPAIDLTNWRQAGADRMAPTGPIRSVICVGRLEGRKGVGTLLAAWPRIAEALPEARLTLAGRGEMADPLPKGVDRLRDLSTPALQRAVAAADLFVAPAGFGESYGLALVEAMATGTPVLAAANPAYAALLNAGRAGSTFRPGDPADLAAQVTALSQAPDIRCSLAQAGRAQAWTADVATVGPAYLKIYEAALSKRAGAGKRD